MGQEDINGLKSVSEERDLSDFTRDNPNVVLAPKIFIKEDTEDS